METGREKFGSNMAVILAMAGSAVGLGNIWRFPYMVGECGGATFILAYIIFGILISLPLFFAESIIGRRGRSNSFGSLRKLAPGTPWKWVGLATIIGCFIIISYYSVVGGWSIDYLLRSCIGGFSIEDPESTISLFDKMSSSVWEPIICHTLFLGATALIVKFGIKKGIESFTKKTMPLLFLLMIAIAVYSLCLPGAGEGVRYLVKFNLSDLNPTTLAYALGQSFFSMSLGVGSILIYSSYMSGDDNIGKTGLFTMIFDTLFALIAAFAIMPAVFSAGLEPDGGPSLVFSTLPYVFAKMGANAMFLSRIITIFFFLAILCAAITSSISLFEVVASFLVEELGWKRKKASIISFVGQWTLGVLCSLSFGVLGNFKIMGRTIFSFCDSFTSNFVMTLGALAFAIFVGWKMSKEDVRDEFTNHGTKNCKIFNTVYFITKFVVPVMIVTIFVTNLVL